MNAHNEQHDPASAVVKQNLTTQPAAAQESAPWRDHDAAIDAKALSTATEIALMWGQDRSQFISRIQVAVIDAMRWVKGGLQPAAAQEAVVWLSKDEAQLALFKAIQAIRFGNPTDDKMILDNLRHEGLWIGRYANAPVTAAPVVAYMVDGRTEQGLTFDKAAAETMALANAGTVRPLGFVDGTPAAPGIDLAELQLIASDLSHSAKVDDYEPHQIAFIESIRDRLLALIDASHKGALNEQFGSAEGLDSPKGGSEARDAARYRWLREFAVNGSIGIPFHGWLNCDEPASEWDSAIDAAMQAGDAEVQP